MNNEFGSGSPVHASAERSTESSVSELNNLVMTAVEPTKIQLKKIKYLLGKDGNCSVASFHVGMPDGSLATVDPFGRVTWHT